MRCKAVAYPMAKAFCRILLVFFAVLGGGPVFAQTQQAQPQKNHLGRKKNRHRQGK